jgi:signal transduction histidine kinase
MLKTQHEQDLLMAQLQVQENTFSWIASEIHDNVGQKLSLAKLQLNKISIAEFNGKNAVLNDSIQIITETLDDLRDLTRSTSNEKINQEGYLGLLKTDIERMNRSGSFHFKLTVTGEEYYLDSKVELMIYRMIQETLNNILKHANATNINLALHYSDEQLELRIEDNGKGFDFQEITKGNGLSNIQKRASNLNGIAVINSIKNKGTTVNIKIPIHGNQKL